MHRSRLLLPLIALVCAFPARSDQQPPSPQPTPAAPPPSNQGIVRDEDNFVFSDEDLQSSRIYFWADKVEGKITESVDASGNVRLRSRGIAMRTERLLFDPQENIVRTPGRVEFERSGDIAEGTQLEYDLDSDQGSLQQPSFRLSKSAQRKIAGRGDGSSARFLGQAQAEFKDARYTTCAPGQDDWFLRARDLSLDRGREIGTARGVSLVFKDVPIAYTPWVDFPLSDRRKSGFLAPVFGTSGKNGFELITPYYWNIAPNYDDTFTPRLLGKRGLQLNNEFRYLQPRFSGQLDTEYLPSDRLAERDRHFVGWRHGHALPWGASGYVNYQHASDDDYFRDLSTRTALTSRVHLPQDAGFGWSNETFSLSGRVLKYQTLQDPSAPVSLPYRLLPQLNANARRDNVRGFDLAAINEYTDFRHPSLVQGKRLIVQPSVAFPMVRSWGYVTPKISYNYSRYNLDERAPAEQQITRSVPLFSVDSGLVFERNIVFRKRNYLQTLEPRLFLLKVPFRDQSNIPNFSTSETDFNFAQMFSENRFVGGDRIGDADQVTAALITRFIDPASGAERLRAAIGQRYNFKEQRVTLFGPPANAKQSDVVAFVSGALSSKWTLESGVQFNTDRGRSERLNFGARYQPELGKVLNIGYRYTRDQFNSGALVEGLRQIDVSAEWPITSRWYGLTRVNYSLRDNTLVEGLVGLEYNKDCWALRLVAHRFNTAERETSTSFFVQLELTGLTKIGNNPLDTLRRNIPGYIQSSEVKP